MKIRVLAIPERRQYLLCRFCPPLIRPLRENNPTIRTDLHSLRNPFYDLRATLSIHSTILNSHCLPAPASGPLTSQTLPAMNSNPPSASEASHVA